MAVSYTIDPTTHVVFTQVEGVLDGQHLYQHQDELRHDPEFHPDMRELMDCTKLQNVKVRDINYSQFTDASPWGSGAKRAIVVSTVLSFGLLNIFQTIMSNKHGNISIFRDMESAKTWLNL